MKERIYQQQKEEIEKLEETKKNKAIERLRQDAYYHLEEIRQKFKNIFLDDLSLINLETLIELEDESLYLAVTLDNAEHQIEKNRKD